MNSSEVRRVARNTAVMVAQYLVTASSTFLVMLFLPRYLGPLEYGRLFLASSIVAMFRLFVEWGGGLLIAKRVARDPQKVGEIAVGEAAFRLLLGLFSFLAVNAFGFVAGYSGEVRILIFICSIGLLWKAIMTICVATFQGMEVMQYSSLANITEAVTSSLGTVAALLLGGNAYVVAIIGQIAGGLNMSVLVRNGRKFIQQLPPINWRAAFQQMKEGIPFFFFTLFSTIYYRIDSIMLSKMSPEEVVGWYGASYRLYDVCSSLPVIFSAAIFPVLSRSWTSQPDAHRKTLQKSVQLMIMLGVVIALAGWYFADHAVLLFYGLPAYAQSVPVLRLLVLGLVILAVDMVLGTTVMASDLQKEQTVISFLAIPVNVGLNFLFIPYFQQTAGNGGVGAGVATVVTELFIMSSMLVILPKGSFKRFRYDVIAKSAIAGVVTYLCLLGMEHLGFNWVVSAACMVIVYFAILWYMNALESSEKRLVMESLASLRGRIVKKLSRG